MHRRVAWGIALVVMGMLAWSAPANAAGKLQVKVLDSDLGKVWDSQRAKVKVDPKKAGKAKVKVWVERASGADPIAKARERVGAKGRTIRAQVTDEGRTALERCSNDTLFATVDFKFKGGGSAFGRAERPADQTFALCSQGSEDPQERPYFGPDIPTENADRCDPLDPSLCMYPFPNDYFTMPDASTDTGLRMNFQTASMPQNASSVSIDVTDYNRADGFSPGEPIIVRIPGLDNDDALDETGGVGLTDLSAYDDEEQPVVVIDAETGERQPIWTEMDSDADSDSDRVLYIRPAVNFTQGHRYIVALRGLKDADGNPIDPRLAFRAYRDNLTTENPAIEDRRAHMEELFSDLQGADIERADLNLAWDFTVASEDSTASRLMAMRDDAFGQLGDTDLGDGTVQGDSPDFTVGSVTDFLPCSAGDPEACETGENQFYARQIDGTIDVPCYLNADNCPVGATFAFSDANDRTPDFNPSFRIQASYRCMIPRPAIDEAEAARPSLYGHGLLGSRTEVSGSSTQTMALNHNIVYCAVDWVGFSNADLPSALAVAGNVSNFPKLVDRTQQGFIDFMYLGRAMIHPDGFTDNAAFQVDPDGDGGEDPQPVYDPSQLVYDGNSQGGILGGALTAMAPDYERAALGVPGMNYATLIQRSTDFATFSAILNPAYPNELQRPLVYSLMQMLWDRGEPSGYAQHMTSDPLDNTPEHTVLLQVALGDFQVSNYEAEVEARTIGAAIEHPTFDEGRYWDPSLEPFGIPEIGSFPSSGSAIQYWDGGPVGFTGTIGNGTGLPPLGNVPPAPGPTYGSDPHSYPRRSAPAQQQKAEFWDGGISGCGGPCYSNGYTGPGP